jgi:hypothetical protein
VVEAHTVAPHYRVQGNLARVSEGRVPDVVCQREGLDQIGIQVET